MYRIILILLLVATQTVSVQLGRIQNVSWVLNSSLINNEYINLSNTTCDQCLCRMLTTNNLTTSVACQQKWKTCQLLFWNATSQLQTDGNSVVYFQTIPTFLQTTSITSKAQKTTTTTSTTTTTTAVPIFLINPGGELRSLDPWIPSSSSSPILDNGTAHGANIAPYNGSYAFYGGPGGGSLHQKVSLTNMFSTARLDSGLLSVLISFWERTWSSSSSDTGEVALNFLSATSTSIGNVTTGPRSCPTAWCHVTGNWSLPVGTRTIDYAMIFTEHIGGYADAWIDDNMLNVA